MDKRKEVLVKCKLTKKQFLNCFPKYDDESPQFKLGENQVPKTLPQVKANASGNLGDVSGSEDTISKAEVIKIIDKWFKEEYLIGALSCDALRDRYKLEKLKAKLQETARNG